VTLEKRGVPTVLICPESFRGIVEAQARLGGIPSYTPVTIPGQVVALSPQELTARLDAVADKLIGGLVSASARP